MMDKTMFERVNLQQLSAFILFREETAMQTGSYEERLDQAKQVAYEALKQASSDRKLNDDVIQDALCGAFGVQEIIYTEIGMKLGARLMLQLLRKEDTVTCDWL